MRIVPKVDARTPEQFAAKVRKLLARSVPGGWPQSAVRGEAGEVLIEIFAQMCGTVVDRLNQAPRKNFLAFLDMQGVAARPAQPARVPLTFHLAAQHSGHVKVASHTQVSAKLEKNEKNPVIFETEREFVVTSANLLFLGTKDGTHDTFADYSPVLGQCSDHGAAIFRGTVTVEHLLYIDLDLQLPTAALKELRVNLSIVAPEQLSSVPWFRWEIKSDCETIPVTPTQDDTAGFSKSGAVVFEALPGIPTTNIPTSAGGVRGQWLVCRLMLPLGTGPGLLSPASLPSFGGAEIHAEFARHAIPLDSALSNQISLDTTKDFFPFGERPKFGDSFYLACGEAFSLADSAVTVQFHLANPEQESPDMRLGPVHGYGLKLLWELGNGRVWIELGTSESGRDVHDEATGFADTTRALTRSGVVSFRVPRRVRPITISGVNNVWIRTRIIAGDYGRDPRLEKPPEPGTRFPSPLAPPCIRSVTVDYDVRTASLQPTIIAYNDFTYSRVNVDAAPVPLFRPLAENGAWFYLGFLDQNGFSDRSMSVYVGVANPGRESAVFESSGSKPVLQWQFWNGAVWRNWTVVDGTDGFTHSGIIRFLAPSDFAAKQEFGKTMSWLRVHFRESTVYEPRIRRIVLNTTMASQAVTLPPEILGTSTGTAGQSFSTTRSPVLEGQQLDIREPTLPSERERHLIFREEGADAIRSGKPSEGPAGQVWVRWHEVPNFETSAEQDRHYTIDRARGIVQFGDGVKGRIPPPLTQNVQMARYRIGGGSGGNRKANTITELKTAIAYIESVTNVEPASGGADAESYDNMLQRAPRQIRHRWRAVTAQDYEDLAMLASPEVVRVRCLPTFDISKESDPTRWRPGVVSVIIAPRSIEGGSFSTQPTAPMPSLELIERVRSFLDTHRPPEVELVIVGPDYLFIKVQTEVAILDDVIAGDVELAVRLAIIRFLHPITGSFDGNGWQFGQEPSRSDLFKVIEETPGVDHVRQLQVIQTESRMGARQQRQFLIFAGEPQVIATLEP